MKSVSMARFELHYYDKTGQRIFDEFGSKKDAMSQLANIKKAEKIDLTKDVAICEYDRNGDLI